MSARREAEQRARRSDATQRPTLLLVHVPQLDVRIGTAGGGQQATVAAPGDRRDRFVVVADVGMDIRYFSFFLETIHCPYSMR